MRTLRVLFFAVIFLQALSCEKTASGQHKEVPVYKSFRDVPGITVNEIEAIEALQAKKVSFVYGILQSTEAFYGQNGEIEGYTELFCKHLTDVFGITFKPAIYEWSDLIAGLAKGSIDFTGELTATEERRETYYMTDAITERPIRSIRLKNATPISQIAASRLPRYGFFDGAVTLKMISSVINQKFETTLFQSHEDVYEALKNEDIDVFFDENTFEVVFRLNDDIVATDVLPLIYNSVSLSTQKAELAPVISIVQKMLNNGYVNLLTELRKQGQQRYLKSKLDHCLSEEEREYIRNNPIVPLAAEFDNYPISFYNKYENKWEGVAFDVLKEVEKLTGLTFEVANAPYTEWADLLKMLEYGTVSIVSELVRTRERESYFIWPETMLMQDKHALISKQEHPYMGTYEILRKKVGLIKSSAHTELFKIWFPSHPSTVEFQNSVDAFQALENGTIDMIMAGQNLLLTMTNYQEQPGYKINILFDRSFESSFGFNRNEHVLRSIIDKTLKQVDIKKVSEKWKRKTYDYRVKLASSHALWFTGSSILFFCVLVLMFVLYRNNRNAEKRLEVLVHKRTAELDEQRKLLEHISLTDQLTKLPNRRNFDMRLDLEWLKAIRKKLPISILMLDIDHFKNYNDKYGHLQGDTALCIIAKIIERRLRRSGDFVARWGGEEFVALLSSTSAEGALKMADLIREDVEKTNVPLLSGAFTKLTISIGVNTQIPEPESSLNDFISAVDEKLYKAKEMGRNKVCAISSYIQ
jgi:diguanylate cyclase (GGDEF)-like protein